MLLLVLILLTALRCGRIQKNDWNMSHRLYQRIEQIVHEISPQLKIFDEASL